MASQQPFCDSSMKYNDRVSREHPFGGATLVRNCGASALPIGLSPSTHAFGMMDLVFDVFLLLGLLKVSMSGARWCLVTLKQILFSRKCWSKARSRVSRFPTSAVFLKFGHCF